MSRIHAVFAGKSKQEIDQLINQSEENKNLCTLQRRAFSQQALCAWSNHVQQRISRVNLVPRVSHLTAWGSKMRNPENEVALV